jgi:hypothetical protein
MYDSDDSNFNEMLAISQSNLWATKHSFVPVSDEFSLSH